MNTIPRDPDPKPLANGHKVPLAYTVELVDVERIAESPLNPRKRYDEAKLKELAASIASKGVLEPVVARLRKGTNGRTHELVFGHRRLRAAILAKVAFIPVRTADYDDEQVLELQVIENGQRDDLHPLEEAEGYEALHLKCKLDIDTIAAKVGKSRAYVYARMKLLSLSPDARKAFYEGSLTASTALYVARIPNAKLQGEALKDLVRGPGTREGEPVGAREAQSLIEHRYMLRLVDAPFDKGDKDLVAAAGACSACPKRTGNQRELFADVKSPDVCTDPSCFAEKKKAHIEKESARLKAKGVEVVKGKPGYGDQINSPDGFASLDDYDYTHGKTFRELLKGKKLATDTAVYFDGQGKTHTLIPKSKMGAVLKAAGVKVAERAKPDRPKVSKMTRARSELIDTRFRDALRDAIHKKGSTDAAWRFMAVMGGNFAKEVERAKGGKLVWFAVAEMLTHGFLDESTVLDFATAYGIDRKKIEKAVDQELAEKAKAAPPAMPKKDAKAVARAAKQLKRAKGKK